MVFSSLLFAFFFLPVVVGLYFLAKEKYRNYLLLAASLIFYAYGEPKFVVVMVASIVLNYLLALLMGWLQDNRDGTYTGAVLFVGIAMNLGVLFTYKYFDFAIDILNRILKLNLPMKNILLPIGISFFTFQEMSYLIDVYRRTVKVQRNFLYLALYVSFFPQLIAGPIVRYSTIEQQIQHRVCTWEGFAQGCRRFMLGFCKKVLLANTLSVIVTDVFSRDVDMCNPLLLWMGAICYTLQLLYDFSGYSDMAIGLGKIFGFTFEENFNYPYIAGSITEYWRRWHISLGQWFRDYVYIPLGGSKVSIPRHLLNMFIVWTLTGIWHGANWNYVAWGMSHFVLLTIEKYMVKPEKRKSKLLHFVWRIVTLLSIIFTCTMFNCSGFKEGIRYWTGMLGGYGTPTTLSGSVLRYLDNYGVFMLASILFATPIMKVVEREMKKGEISGRIYAIASPIIYMVGFLWAVSYLLLGAHNPFIYFNF